MSPRVLVVHSDPDVIARVGRALGSGGSPLPVQSFTSGAAALGWLAAGRETLRLVLIGGALRDPVAGGIVSAVRADPALRRLPIVLMPDAPAGAPARSGGAWANGRLVPCAEDAAFDAMVRTVVDYWTRWNTAPYDRWPGGEYRFVD
jgi:CheY-like chemotaxis protein